MEMAALITGSSRGIGKAIAQRLCANMPVIIHCRKETAAANALLDHVITAGGEAMVVQGDVGNPADVERMFAEIKAKGYWVHTLVNNASITRDQIVATMKLDDWQQVINTNLNGAFYCIKLAVGTMMARRSGNIVNVSSVAGLHGQFGQINYSSAKAGLIGMTKSLAKELGRSRIRVNAVAPGLINTDMLDAVRANPKSQEWMELAVGKIIPLARLGEPKEVAEVVHFLTTPAASYVTGQVIEIDGGMCL